MDKQVEIVEVKEDGGYFNGGTIQGETYVVTLRRGNEYAQCSGILYVVEEELDNECFDIWLDMAASGEEGFKIWQV